MVCVRKKFGSCLLKFLDGFEMIFDEGGSTQGVCRRMNGNGRVNEPPLNKNHPKNIFVNKNRSPDQFPNTYHTCELLPVKYGLLKVPELRE